MTDTSSSVGGFVTGGLSATYPQLGTPESATTDHILARNWSPRKGAIMGPKET